VTRRTPRIQLTPRKIPERGNAQVIVESLLQATARVLVRDGFDAANTSEIARTAGVSVGSLYHYFPNKESLTSALYEQTEQDAVTYVAENLAEARELKLEDTCYLLVLAMVKVYADERALWSVLLGALPSIGAERKRTQIEARWHELFRSFFTTYPDDIRPEQVEFAAFLMRRAICGTLETIVRERPALLDEEYVADELTELMWGYLRG
jgi:AcrR family transcriptional regulator